MSKPGALKGSELKSVGGGFRLAIHPANRWNACKKELVKAFPHIPPILTGITGYPHSGGYRTAAEQRAINPRVSVQFSDHTAGRGIDVFYVNRYLAANASKFHAICAKYGIRFQVRGEPWHGKIKTTPWGRKFYKNTDTGQWFIIGYDYETHTTNPALAAIWKAQFGQSHKINTVQLAAIRKSHNV